MGQQGSQARVLVKARFKNRREMLAGNELQSNEAGRVLSDTSLHCMTEGLAELIGVSYMALGPMDSSLDPYLASYGLQYYRSLWRHSGLPHIAFKNYFIFTVLIQ